MQLKGDNSILTTEDNFSATNGKYDQSKVHNITYSDMMYTKKEHKPVYVPMTSRRKEHPSELAKKAKEINKTVQSATANVPKQSPHKKIFPHQYKGGSKLRDSKNSSLKNPTD